MIKQVFREQGMSFTRVFEWHTLFRARLTTIEDMTTPESHQLSNIVAKIQYFFPEDRRQAIQNLVDKVEIGYGKCQQILAHELGMQLLPQNFCPGPSLASTRNSMLQL